MSANKQPCTALANNTLIIPTLTVVIRAPPLITIRILRMSSSYYSSSSPCVLIIISAAIISSSRSAFRTKQSPLLRARVLFPHPDMRGRRRALFICQRSERFVSQKI